MSQYLPNKVSYIPQTAAELNDYIKNGAYILTIRVNNLYIVRRDNFYLIPSISAIYGLLKFPYNDNYWFNSGLSIFNYNTLFEDKALYQYDKSRYFDSEFNIINSEMLYCMIRLTTVLTCKIILFV